MLELLFFEHYLDNMDVLGSAGRPCRCAAVCLAVLAGLFNTRSIGEGPGIWIADVGSGM